MNVDSESINYPPTEGAVPLVVDAPDIEMVVASDSSGAKIVRNVQTQHGDYRSVDAENIFLIPRCLWPDEDEGQSTLVATTSSDTSAGASGSGSGSSGCTEQPPKEEEAEQVVWIEPFANEVCSQSYFAVKNKMSI